MENKNTNKVRISKTTLEETEYIYPLYIYNQSEFAEDRYLKITENSWTSIHFNLDGRIDYSESSHHEFTPVPEWVLKNLCDEKTWLQGLNEFKNYIKL